MISLTARDTETRLVHTFLGTPLSLLAPASELCVFALLRVVVVVVAAHAGVCASWLDGVHIRSMLCTVRLVLYLGSFAIALCFWSSGRRQAICANRNIIIRESHGCLRVGLCASSVSSKLLDGVEYCLVRC